MLRVFTLFSLLAVLFATSGCTGAAVAVIDEKISQMTEQDCTSVNLMLGESYCKEKRLQIKQDPVYCYRTLGGVDCYATPDPYRNATNTRVKQVSALGSEGAKVTYLGQKEPSKPLFSWFASDNKSETADLD